jgi:hypothetical protein
MESNTSTILNALLVLLKPQRPTDYSLPQQNSEALRELTMERKYEDGVSLNRFII